MKAVELKKRTLIFVFAASSFALADVCAQGVIGGSIKWIGDRTGIAPVSKLGTELDNASRDIKKEVPALETIDQGVSRPFRETGKWIEAHPEETIIVIAAVAIGWAACIDGCALIGSFLAGGTAIPAISIEPDKSPETSSQPTQAKATLAEKEDNRTTVVHQNPSSSSPSLAQSREFSKAQLERIYTDKYSARDFPKGKPPTIVYRSANERLNTIFNTFSPPSSFVKVRVPQVDDGAGGVFESRRGIGDDGIFKRVHAANDFLMPPGHPVMAVLTGRVDKIGKTETGFSLISIVSLDGTTGRVLYVVPNASVKVGMEVSAGVSPLGVAADLSTEKKYADVPNHVHVDFTDAKGRRFDPWTNKVVSPDTVKGARVPIAQ